MDVVTGYVGQLIDHPLQLIQEYRTLFVYIVVVAAAGVLLGLFGQVLVRLWGAIIGFAAAAVGAVFVCQMMGLDANIMMIVMLAAGAVVAILCAVFRHVGAFVFCFIGASVLLLDILQPENWILVSVAGGVGLLWAILAMIFLDPMVIILSGCIGGYAVGYAITQFVVLPKPWFAIALQVILAIVFMWIQFIVKSRSIGRKQKKHSNKVRSEISMESEIEQARNILDLEDIVPDEDSEEKNED